MPYLLRLFVYDNTDRSMYSPLGEKRIDQRPSLGYGTGYNHDGHDYVVADIPRMKSIPDPDNPDGGLIQYDVYMAKAEHWWLFKFPEFIPGRKVE